MYSICASIENLLFTGTLECYLPRTQGGFFHLDLSLRSGILYQIIKQPCENSTFLSYGLLCWPFKIHSNESYWAVLSCDAVCYAVQCGFNFWVCGWNPKEWPFNWKLLSSTFLWCCLLCCTRRFYLLSLWMKSSSVTIQMKAIEQYFPVVLFIMLYKVVLTFESVRVTVMALFIFQFSQVRIWDF